MQSISPHVDALDFFKRFPFQSSNWSTNWSTNVDVVRIAEIKAIVIWSSMKNADCTKTIK